MRSIRRLCALKQNLAGPGLDSETRESAQRPHFNAPTPPAVDTGDDDQIGGPGTPVSITFLAGHYQDAKLCTFARAYEQATGFEKLHPKLP